MEAVFPSFGFVGAVRMPVGVARLRRGGSFPVQRGAWHAIRGAFRTGSLVAGSRDAASDDLAEVRAIAAGDSAAFRRLIDRESPRLLRFALGLLGNLDEAEDVVQETLLRLWENAATWTPDARIGTWLYRVCYNRCIDRLRRRRSFVDDSALDALPDEAQPPDLQIVRSERVYNVREAVARLAPRQRTAVLLFHFQDLPQREAAEVMGISEVALESLLARARRQMRLWLAVEAEND
jgi:RNA polymerase sigma-70 factor (ECF subfamily)